MSTDKLREDNTQSFQIINEEIMMQKNKNKEIEEKKTPPILLINQSQILLDQTIMISNQKLNSNEKTIDLEANIICDQTKSSNNSNLRTIASNKLKNVGKIISDKISSKLNNNNNNSKTKNEDDENNVVDIDDDDEDDDYNDYSDQVYEESYLNKMKDNDYKISTDKNVKIDNAVLYEENDEEPDDNLEETSCFLNNTKINSDSTQPITKNINESNNSETKPKKDLKFDINNNNLTLPSNSFVASYSSSSIATTSASIINNNNNNNNNSTVPQARILKKTMTQGSKAMRLMGNNNITNGPLNKLNSLNDSLNPNNTTSNALSTLNQNKKLQQKRLFFKNGNINISRSNIDKRRRRYLTDIFTTLIDLKWRYNLLVFAFGFLASWIIFASIWYFISYIHGDLDVNNLADANYTACVSGIKTFASAILFSIETQQTIGYGVRYTTEKCPEAIFIMMIQSSIGVMIQSFMVGVVFAKLSRPKKRSETLMFSKNAVISLRDGRLCLICRVGDMRKSHIVEAHVRMYLIKKKVTQEGEIMPLHMYDLNVGWDKGLDRLFLVWPLTIEHYIDQNSPFWALSAEEMRKERFELAVILEGIVESTGMTTQARSSYLVNEILWGHRFEKLITFQKEDGTYKIDYSRFNMTIPVDTPTCSAKDLAELKEQEQSYSDNPMDTSTKLEEDENKHSNDLRRRKNDNQNDITVASLTESIGNNSEIS